MTMPTNFDISLKTSLDVAAVGSLDVIFLLCLVDDTDMYDAMSDRKIMFRDQY